MSRIRRTSIAFAAGAVGALANSAAAIAAGRTGLTALLGVRLAPEFSPPWLYQRLVWGGLWGLLLLLPLLKGSPTVRGLLVSLAPTAVALFVVFPSRGGGMAGLELGLLTPLVALALNAVWGVAAAWWYRWAGG